MGNGKIIIAGSANTDIVLKLSRMLAQGECVIVDSQHVVPGGKGANRAVALARLGDDPAFACCIGNDSFGDWLYGLYESEGLSRSLITRTADAGTGAAYIMLDRDGNNRIAVYPGANDLMRGDVLDAAVTALDDADFLSLEFEIPLESVERLNFEACSRGVLSVIDAGPIRDGVPLDIFKGAFILSPNESETLSLTGISPDTEPGAEEAAAALYNTGVKNVILKLGERGSLLYNGKDYYRCPAAKCPAEVTDTTGAGDSYMAALLFGLKRNKTIPEAMRFASAAAAVTVTRLGAIPSLPRLYEINYQL